MANLEDISALIVCGDADGAFRFADRDRFATLFPNHRIATLAGAKHFIQENAPAKIASAIRKWLVN